MPLAHHCNLNGFAADTFNVFAAVTYVFAAVTFNG